MLTAHIRGNNIGISTNVFHNPRNIAELVGILSINFNAIEIEIENEFRNNYDNHNYLTKEIAQINYIKDFVNPNLNLTIHAPYIGENTDIANSTTSIRRAAVKNLGSAIEFAAQIGVDRVTIHPGYIRSDSEIKDKLNSLKLSLHELNDIASEHNVNILLENTGKNRPAYIILDNLIHLDLCQAFSQVFLTLDLVHFNSFFRGSCQHQENLIDMIPYVKNVHFADMVSNEHRHLPLGFGDLDYQSDIIFLINHGYKYNFIVEETITDHFSYEYLQQAINFKKSIRE